MTQRKPVGWRGESRRHAKAAREGWRTRRKEARAKHEAVRLLRGRGYNASICPKTGMVVVRGASPEEVDRVLSTLTGDGR